MSIFKNSTMETFYGSDDGVGEADCEVRFQGGEIIISYATDDGHDIYRGIEEGAGHYRLTRDGGGGKATLHRFAGDDVLDGYWIEDRSTGMWRITLGE